MQSCHIINHLKVHLHSGHRVRLHPSPDPRSDCSEGLVLRLGDLLVMLLNTLFSLLSSETSNLSI